MLLKPRWPELRPIVKASSIAGLIIGGVGSWKTLSLVISVFHYVFTPLFGWEVLVFLIGLVLLGGLAALVSGLSLVFLSLSEEQSRLLSFFSVMGSFTTVLFLYYIWSN